MTLPDGGALPTLALITVKASLAITVAWGLTRALRRARAALRHAIWTAASSFAFVVALVSLAPWNVELPVLPARPSAAVTPDHTQIRRTPVTAIDTEPAPRQTAAPAPRSSRGRDLAWLLVLHLAGTALVVSRIALGHVRAARLIAGSRPVAPGCPWSDHVRALPGIRHAGVRIRTSSAVPTPLTCGFLRPVILLPPAPSGWTGADRRRALLHELAHVRRRDALTLLVAQVACAVHWFNPLAWLAARRQHLEAEIACDAAVTASGEPGAQRYARQLVDLARNGAPRTLATVGMSGRSEIGRRVAAILQAEPAARPSARACVAIASAALLSALALPLSIGPADAHHTDVHERFRTPLTRAAASGDLAEVTRIVAGGADVDAAPPGDATALMEAAERGHVEIVAFLIETGADVNARIDGDGTPLIAAAGSHDVETARLLLDAGADVNAGVEGDGNPLIAAVRAGDVRMVRLLLDSGADPLSYVRGDETALDAAHEQGAGEILDLLLAAARE